MYRAGQYVWYDKEECVIVRVLQVRTKKTPASYLIRRPCGHEHPVLESQITNHWKNWS